ncbi:MAG: hypothetical protein ACOCZ5_01520 [bacterium]
MNNLVMKMVFFSIMLNFAVGIMITAVPAFEGMDTRLGLNEEDINNQTYGTSEILDQFGNPINANPTGEDMSTLSSDTLMDRTILGGVTNIIEVIEAYMFGFVIILQNLFGAWVPALVFNLLKIILGMLYSITIFELISGRRLLGD